MIRNIAATTLILVLAGLGGCVVSKDEYDSLAAKNKKLEATVESQRLELSRREVKKERDEQASSRPVMSRSRPAGTDAVDVETAAQKDAEITRLQKELAIAQADAVSDRKAADAQNAKLIEKCKSLQAELDRLSAPLDATTSRPTTQRTGTTPPDAKTSAESYDALLQEIRNRRFGDETGQPPPSTMPTTRMSSPTTAPASRPATTQATSMPVSSMETRPAILENPPPATSGELNRLRQQLAVATELNKALQTRYCSLAKRHQELLDRVSAGQQAKTN